MKTWGIKHIHLVIKIPNLIDKCKKCDLYEIRILILLIAIYYSLQSTNWSSEQS